MERYLHVAGVTKRFPASGTNGSRRDELCVFEEVDLEMRRGEFIAMIGHSGCGKSTLLNIIAGFEASSDGHVTLDGRTVAEPGLDRMVVFQGFALMPWLSAFENIELAVRAASPGSSRREIRDKTERYIDLMGLRGAEDKKPALLSGGMRQRVGLARAFSVEPKVLLLDEPFAQIDALTRGVIQDELIRLWEATGATIFMVTHDVDEAILLSDRIALMTSGPHARLAEIVEVEIPRPRRRADLIEMDEYFELRKRILRFLMQNTESRVQSTELADDPAPQPEPKPQPMASAWR